MLLNGNPVDALAVIVHKKKAYSTGKRICVKLKDNIHRSGYYVVEGIVLQTLCMYYLFRQLYEVAIQAAIGNKVIARET